MIAGCVYGEAKDLGNNSSWGIKAGHKMCCQWHRLYFQWQKTTKPHTIFAQDKSSLTIWLKQARGKAKTAHEVLDTRCHICNIFSRLRLAWPWDKNCEKQKHQEKSVRSQHFSKVHFSQKLFLCAQGLNRTQHQQRHNTHCPSNSVLQIMIKNFDQGF